MATLALNKKATIIGVPITLAAVVGLMLVWQFFGPGSTPRATPHESVTTPGAAVAESACRQVFDDSLGMRPVLLEEKVLKGCQQQFGTWLSELKPEVQLADDILTIGDRPVYLSEATLTKTTKQYPGMPRKVPEIIVVHDGQASVIRFANQQDADATYDILLPKSGSAPEADEDTQGTKPSNKPVKAAKPADDLDGE